MSSAKQSVSALWATVECARYPVFLDCGCSAGDRSTVAELTAYTGFYLVLCSGIPIGLFGCGLCPLVATYGLAHLIDLIVRTNIE